MGRDPRQALSAVLALLCVLLALSACGLVRRNLAYTTRIGRFRRPCDRSTYTSMSSGRSPAELAAMRVVRSAGISPERSESPKAMLWQGCVESSRAWHFRVRSALSADPASRATATLSVGSRAIRGDTLRLALSRRGVAFATPGAAPSPAGVSPATDANRRRPKSLRLRRRARPPRPRSTNHSGRALCPPRPRTGFSPQRAARFGLASTTFSGWWWFQAAIRFRRNHRQSIVPGLIAI